MIKLVSLKDIIDNEYNLNIPRYIPKQEEEENFDIDQILSELIECNRDIARSTQQVNEYLRQLGMKEIEWYVFPKPSKFIHHVDDCKTIRRYVNEPSLERRKHDARANDTSYTCKPIHLMRASTSHNLLYPYTTDNYGSSLWYVDKG